MDFVRSHLAQTYRQTVDAYLARPGEDALSRAYDLGRAALSDGIGVLDVVLFHHATLAELVASHPLPALVVERAQAVLLEVLSPFEVARRDFRDGNEALRRLNEALEAEARRIAHSLHDDAGQLVVAVNLGLHELLREHPQCAESVRRLRRILDGMEAQLRQLSHELCPTVLDDLGLIPALESLADGVRDRSGLDIVVAGSTDGRLPPAVEIALYRTVQEALTNVVRHAGATSAQIEVERIFGAVMCTVTDDGQGLPPVAPKGSRSGIGLIGIRQRLERVGGDLRLGKSPGGGTSLEATVPLAKDWRDRDAQTAPGR